MAELQILKATVPATALAPIAHKVALMTKRCLRVGMPAPTLSETGRHFEPDFTGAAPGTPVALLPKLEMVDLELASPARIELGGWALLGRVDALPDGQALVARTPGTEDVPLPLVSSPYACQHCGKARVRNATFLVYNAGGQVRQVGRNCLRDFLGHDPSTLLWWHEALAQLAGSLGAYGPAGERLWDTAAVLTLAARVTAHGGFLGRAKANEINAEIEEKALTRPPVISTAAQVTWRLDPPPVGSRERRSRALQIADWDARYPADEAATELLKATTEALASLAPSNEWEANVAAVVTQPRLRSRHFGVAVSAVILGLRQQEKEAAAHERAAPAPSQHLGVVGDRLVLPAVIGFVREFPGEEWGPRTLVKLEAAEGALLWWASSAPQRPDRDQSTLWVVGDEVTITGTVKAHEFDKYDGRAVTVLNRCTLKPRAGLAVPAAAG